MHVRAHTLHLPLHCDPPENHLPSLSPTCKINKNNSTEPVYNLNRSKCTGVCVYVCARARDRAKTRRVHYSLIGLFGAPCGAAPGDTPPLPLPRAPSPRSESKGDRSPSAIPRARRIEGERREYCCVTGECVSSPPASHGYVRCCGNACAHPCARGVYCMIPLRNRARHAVYTVTYIYNHFKDY